MLKPKNELTLNLFAQEKRKENLTEAMDKVNKKYGELTLYPAVLLSGAKISKACFSHPLKIKSEVNGFLGDKGFRFAKMPV